MFKIQTHEGNAMVWRMCHFHDPTTNSKSEIHRKCTCRPSKDNTIRNGTWKESGGQECTELLGQFPRTSRIHCGTSQGSSVPKFESACTACSREKQRLAVQNSLAARSSSSLNLSTTSCASLVDLLNLFGHTLLCI